MENMSDFALTALCEMSVAEQFSPDEMIDVASPLHISARAPSLFSRVNSVDSDHILCSMRRRIMAQQNRGMGGRS